MDWLKPLDEYCERLDAGFWAEPVNALSNLSFILAAVFAFRLKNKLSRVYISHFWLVLLVFAIGVGSFLYHAFANVWSLFADIIPIYLFQVSVIAVYGCAIARRSNKSQYLGGFFLVLAFLGVTAAFSYFPKGLFNGSVGYFSALLSLFLIGIYQAKCLDKERFTLLLAAFLFALSLVFRSVDFEVCAAFQVGTHFMWHIINGGVLYLTVRAYVGVLLGDE